MAELINGVLATGDNSFTPGQAPPVSRSGSEPWRLDQNMNPNNNDSGDNDSNGNGDSDDMN